MNPEDVVRVWYWSVLGEVNGDCTASDPTSGRTDASFFKSGFTFQGVSRNYSPRSSRKAERDTQMVEVRAFPPDKQFAHRLYVPNVLVSGVFWRGRPHDILIAWAEDRVEVLVSPSKLRLPYNSGVVRGTDPLSMLA